MKFPKLPRATSGSGRHHLGDRPPEHEYRPGRSTREGRGHHRAEADADQPRGYQSRHRPEDGVWIPTQAQWERLAAGQTVKGMQLRPARRGASTGR